MNRDSLGQSRLLLAGLVMVVMSIVYTPLHAQIMKIIEAEDATVTRAEPAVPYETMWASGGAEVAMWWGEHEGDAVSFPVALGQAARGLKMGIRYSYCEREHRQHRGFAGERGTLSLYIDDNPPLAVAVPDTGWWDDFETAVVKLPDLEAGEHRFVLKSDRAGMTTNIDAFVFFQGEKETAIPDALRSTIVARSEDGKMAIKMTPGAQPKVTTRYLMDQFQRISDFFQMYMGWQHDREVLVIHVIEDRKWDNPGAISYENGWGVFFKESNVANDPGNWVHEMHHVYHNGWMPMWIDHPLIRTADAFDSVGYLYPEPRYAFDARTNAGYRDRMEQGKRLLENPGMQTSDPHEIIYAIRVKYGEGVLSRFYHAVARERAAGRLKLERGRPLGKADIVRFFSEAAGEDVTPIFRQWIGFREAP